VHRVLSAYEAARHLALAQPAELKRIFIAATKLSAAVVDKQLDERTDLSISRIGEPQRRSILAAGMALQQAGVIATDVDIKANVEALIEPVGPLP
jgi:sulfonate transport system substrate-binding protein